MSYTGLLLENAHPCTIPRLELTRVVRGLFIFVRLPIGWGLNIIVANHRISLLGFVFPSICIFVTRLSLLDLYTRAYIVLNIKPRRYYSLPNFDNASFSTSFITPNKYVVQPLSVCTCIHG
jgi:hypothetical protein